ncbi:MAG: hypothetical protein SOW44_03250 [Porphyromonas sp.]|nr:hypothetical protein [Bacteroidales bacterium]MDD7559956.1 hypothetical protein [Bacteroidales bacterium]MDY3100341.1 hypothetical protein [Porphyromonas sp.]
MDKTAELKVGDKAKVSPELTGLDQWVEGEIIDVEQNPFRGVVLSLVDMLGRIYFGDARYFIPLH